MTILRRALPNQPKAITIDFWDTMVDARVNGLKRQTQRLDALQEVGIRTDPSNPIVCPGARTAKLVADVGLYHIDSE